MKIKLKLYGASKTLSETDNLSVILSNHSSVKDLRAYIKKLVRQKNLTNDLKYLSSSVVFSTSKNKIINDNYKFKNNETISVIPPIGGG